MKVANGTTEVTMQKASEIFQQHPSDWLGPSLAGLCINLVFLGLLFSQATHYYTFYYRDSIWLKGQVALTVVLSILKTASELNILWDKLILHFGDWEYAAKSPLLTAAEPLTCNLLSLTALTFFIYRAWILTSRNWVYLLILVVWEIAIVLLSVFVTQHFYLDPYGPGVQDIYSAMLILTVGADFFVTGVTVYRLARAKKGSNAETTRLVNKLIWLTFEGAVAPCICALLNLITYQLLYERDTVGIMFATITPRLYICSFLFSLNSRGHMKLISGTLSTPTQMTWDVAPGAGDDANGTPEEKPTKAHREVVTKPESHGEIPVHTSEPPRTHLTEAEAYINHIRAMVNVNTALHSRYQPDAWSETSVNRFGQGLESGKIITQ